MEQEDLQKQLEQHENEKQELFEELRRLKRKPEGKFSYLLFSFGIVLLSLAIYYSHNVSAFIGIAFTFLGAILFKRKTLILYKRYTKVR